MSLDLNANFAHEKTHSELLLRLFSFLLAGNGGRNIWAPKLCTQLVSSHYTFPLPIYVNYDEVAAAAAAGGWCAPLVHLCYPECTKILF